MAMGVYVGNRLSNIRKCSLNKQLQNTIKQQKSKKQQNIRIIQCRQYDFIPPGPELDIFPPDIDPVKEKSRQFRRAVFNHDRWASHRSTKRYLRHLQGIFGSRIVYGLLKPVSAVSAIAVLFSTYMTLMEADMLPNWLSYPVILRSDPFSLSSFALALLLVFRTDASYGRWEQAQRCWEQIISQSRAVVRESYTMLRSAVGVQDRVGDWICAYAHCVAAELRENINLEHQLDDRLNQQEIDFIMSVQDKPAAVLQILSKYISTEILLEENVGVLNEHLRILEESSITARRIFRSPIPLSYTRHTSRFLMVWLAFLPVSIWHDCGWFTVPATSVTAFLLLGIEEIGVQVEEPFGILPLEYYCNQIEQGVNEQLAQRKKISQLVDARISNNFVQNSVQPVQQVER